MLNLDQRPILVVLAGSNGAGKTTFYETHLKTSGLEFLNADILARQLEVDPYKAAEMVNGIRRLLIEKRQSFIFETVFSDPVGGELQFFKETAKSGYQVVVCFIGIPDVTVSEERVSIRVIQGGHDVPTEKLKARFPRTMANLVRAIRELPTVFVFDNGDMARPFRKIAAYQEGKLVENAKRVPAWFRRVMDGV